jgi:hypothetical protein
MKKQGRTFLLPHPPARDREQGFFVHDRLIEKKDVAHTSFHCNEKDVQSSKRATAIFAFVVEYGI